MYKLTPDQIRAHLRKENPIACKNLGDGIHIFFVNKAQWSWEKLDTSLTPISN
jgi:hypothetical protein